MSSTIKKAYIAIATLLSSNMDATVADIYPEFEKLASAKTGGGGGKATTFHRDADGNVTALFCAYFKKWFPVGGEVEFGAKASTQSGFNNYSKLGLSHWNKQLAEFKKAKDELLIAVAADPSKAATLQDDLDALEEARAHIEHVEGGFDTLEELLEAQA